MPDPHGRARLMLDFVDVLKHPRSDAPDKAIVLPQFWREALARIYGPSDTHGRRLCRTAFVFIPRGARKSTIAGIIALAHTVGPFRMPGAQVISAGADREQASKAFDEAVGILRMVPALAERAKIRDWDWYIRHAKTGAEYRAIPANADAQLGSTPSVVIADELVAAWRGRKALSLWSALATGTAKIPESLTIIITTAGDGRDQALGNDLYRHAKRVASGEVIDPTFVPIIYEAPPELPWDDEATWAVANPGLAEGFPDRDGLRAQARLAKQVPALRQAFEQFHLNRMGDGSAAGWVDLALFDVGAAEIDRTALRGKPCWIAVDMSRSFDLTGVVACFRDEGRGYIALPLAFIPEDTLRTRALASDLPWKEWAAEGHLRTIPGKVIRDDEIEEAIVDLAAEFDVVEIAFDPKFASRLMVALEERGLPVVAHGQSAMHATAGVTEAQRAILDGKLTHDGNPVLRWAVSNAVPNINATGLVRLDKARSHDSIDLAQALCMAIGRAAAAPEPVPDVWDADDFDPRMVMFG